MENFLTFQDYAPIIRSETRNILIEDRTLIEVQETVIQEAKEALRKKYIIEVIFMQEGENRYKPLVFHLSNMVIYRAHIAVSNRVIPKQREDLYVDAQEWLKRVALPSDHTKAIFPDLPLSQTENSEQTFRAKSNKKYKTGF
ncbi:hypothetical protein V9L05_20530 [Bernardetia sp. Wsw4-3y2]|uniref:hypothetical protein n=1 Tax=Bernardetia sp. Wsw4-3y2 TaxID=3127471 RepID=UPI0030D49A5D